jgi:uncharacterized protein YdaT
MMKRTFDDLEPMLKELNPKVREKAIELADEMLVDGRHTDAEQALKDGIKLAEEWFSDLEG